MPLSCKFKYVVKDGIAPVVFSECQKHSDFQHACSPITSAGFGEIYFEDGGLKVSCWGRSISLNIDSNPAIDERLIRKLFVEGS